MQLIKILDIDLDFFLSGVSMKSETPGKRLCSNNEVVWPSKAVVDFLESRFKLSKNHKIKGKLFTNHHEVLYFIRELVLSSKQKLMFHFDHVDAHSDLDNRANCYKYLFLEHLRLPRRGRMHPKKKYLDEGNYLLFLASAEWLYSLNHISLEEFETYNAWFFKDYNVDSNIIKLEAYTERQIPTELDENEKHERLKNLNPYRLLKDIPFNQIYYQNFNSKYEYDYILLTQSPEYTPKESDDLIPIIKEYMEEI